MNGEKHKEKLPAQNSAEQEYRGTEGDSSDRRGTAVTNQSSKGRGWRC